MVGCLLVVAAIWALYCTLVVVFSENISGLYSLVILIIGWAPAIVLGAIAKSKQTTSKLRKIQFIELSGLSEDNKFYYWTGAEGVALNPATSTIALASTDAMKAYKFTDVRSWEIRQNARQIQSNDSGLFKDAGLFIRFKDLEYPEWQIQMNKETQNRWFEILTQALNEGGVSQ